MSAVYVVDQEFPKENAIVTETYSMRAMYVADQERILTATAQRTATTTARTTRTS
jgi:hypothetical protein